MPEQEKFRSWRACKVFNAQIFVIEIVIQTRPDSTLAGLGTVLNYPEQLGQGLPG